MKNLVATICIAGSVLALAACNTMGNDTSESAAPYSSERTAGGTNAPAPAGTHAQSERVFRGTQSK